MSNEFKIKVGVDLDDSEARSKFSELQNLGKEKIKIEIDIDLKDITKQLNSIAKEFKNAFKIDSTLTSDITKLGNALKKLNDTASGGGTGGGNRSSVSELVSEYKTLATTVEKLQKQMNKGVMDDGSIQRTKALIDDLEAEMNALYNSMSDNSKKRIDLFNAKQSIKGLADIKYHKGDYAGANGLYNFYLNNICKKLENTTPEYFISHEKERRHIADIFLRLADIANRRGEYIPEKECRAAAKAIVPSSNLGYYIINRRAKGDNYIGDLIQNEGR